MQPYADFPLIIAHRGASSSAPENTLAAFRRAIEDGADGLEFDVRLAKDGVPVVFHDRTLRRVAQKNLLISGLTSAELQTFDVGSWFNALRPRQADAKFARETVPTLAQFFAFLGGYQGRLYLELKCRNAEISALVEAVLKVIGETDRLSQIVVKSFKLDAVLQAREMLPEIRTAALFAPKILTLVRKQSRLVERALEFKADELSLHFSLATRKVVETAEKCGLPVTIWTADHPVWVRRASEIGIRAIITNNPARLLAERREILNQSSILA